MSGFEGRDAVAGYLASKGLPMTGENVRRALEQNAANPGLIKGLVNQAPPPPDAQGGASPTSNQRGSAPDSLAQRMHQTQPAAQSTQPTAASDSASSAPTAQPTGGGGMLSSLAQMILGGGAGAGLAHLFMGGRGSPAPMPQLGIPYPTPTADGMPQLPAPQAALPAPSPSPVGGPAQLGGPAAMPQLGGPPSPVAGVNPIGPPQPGRLEPGPSSPVPPPSDPIAMPRNTGQSMVMQGAPVSTAMAGGGRVASPVELPQGMDWGKILGDIGHVIGRR